MMWRETAIVRGAIALGLLHTLDETAIRPGPGVSRSEAPSALLGVFTVALLVAVLAPRVGAGVRALIFSALGALFASNGATHVVHAVTATPTGVDWSGFGAAAGGALLLVAAASRAGRAAWSTTARPVHRWLRLGSVVALTGLITMFVLVPVAVGTANVHQPRRSVAPAPADGFMKVEIRTEDGLTLSAWFHPSTNGAAVVLLNPSRGDHRSVGGHARMLVQHGFGVLVYDARGTGASQGTPNGWGWTWAPDVAAAVDYVLSQPDVDQVGLLGLSTGADVAIEYAATDDRVRVVVADGATAQSVDDRPSGWVDALSLWPMFTAAQLVTGDRPAPPLAETIASIAPRPVLLVAAGTIPAEIPLNQRYAAAGGRTVRLWALPAVAHTAALREMPGEYTRMVMTTLGGALLGPGAPS